MSEKPSIKHFLDVIGEMPDDAKIAVNPKLAISRDADDNPIGVSIGIEDGFRVDFLKGLAEAYRAATERAEKLWEALAIHVRSHRCATCFICDGAEKLLAETVKP